MRSSQHVYKQKDLFQALLTNEDREFLIYDPAGSLWFSSLVVDEMNVSLMHFVQTYLSAFLKVPNQCVERQIRDKIYTLKNRISIMRNRNILLSPSSKKRRSILRRTSELLSTINPTSCPMIS